MSKTYWLDQGFEKKIPESFLMIDTYLIVLVKQSPELDNEEKICGFLCL